MIIGDPLFRIVIYALDIYVWMVIASVIISWLIHFGVVNTRNQFVHMISDFLWRITEPALRRIRKFLPNFGGMDLSPIALILIIYFLQMVLINIHRELFFA